MSMLIKGIDMPKDSIGIELVFIPKDGDITNNESMSIGVEQIVEIPTPHGRLIDADIMQREAYQKNFDGIISDMALFNLNYYLEEKAQIILEAEV